MNVEWFGPARSLRRFQSRISLGYVLLIVFSGVLGLLGTRPWEAVSHEISRLAALESEVYAIRGTLYRQVKEVFDDILLGDPSARSEYGVFTRRIGERFDVLESRLRQPEEERLARELRDAYGEVLRISETLMRNARPGAERPNPAETEAVLRLMHTEIESGAFQRYEDVLARFEALLQQEHVEQTAQLTFLTRWVPVVLALTVSLAALLMVYASAHLRRHFSRPLGDVLDATRRIREGDLSHRVPDRGTTELRSLAQGINAMAAELDASRKALVQSERQAVLGALIPVVAHNIRNPLASIRATAQIADAPELPADTREALADIIGASDRLAAWTHALLSYLHPLQPRLAALDLRQVVDQALALHGTVLDARGLAIERQGWSQALPLQADPELLEQAVSALLVNAAEASPQNGLLTLSLGASAGEAWLSVRDRGPGWRGPPALHGLPPLPSSKPGGSGLGLPFCTKVCESHGGRLEFLSPPSGGTEARIRLPRAPGGPLSGGQAAFAGDSPVQTAFHAWAQRYASSFDRPRRP